MDRKEALQRVTEHKAKAVIARNENRFWDALFEEALAFHFRNQGINLPDDGGLMQARQAFVYTMMKLRLSAAKQTEIVTQIVQWSQENGKEADLNTILERFRS